MPNAVKPHRIRKISVWNWSELPIRHLASTVWIGDWLILSDASRGLRKCFKLDSIVAIFYSKTNVSRSIGYRKVNMSRLFYSPFKRFCVKCKDFPAVTARCYSYLLTPIRCPQLSKQQTFVVLQQQQRKCFGPSRLTSRFYSRSKFWIGGIGAGIVLALGLKYHTDIAELSCEEDFQHTGRYGAAIQVSRDLVQRIKVQVFDVFCIQNVFLLKLNV